MTRDENAAEDESLIKRLTRRVTWNQTYLQYLQTSSFIFIFNLIWLSNIHCINNTYIKLSLF